MARWLSLALVVLALGAGGRAVAAAQDDVAIHVDVDGELLTLDARDAPLAEVLRRIADAAGIELTIRGRIATRVTRSLKAVPLDQAIKRLARGHSLALVYEGSATGRQEHALQEVWIIESGSDVRAAPREQRGQLGTLRALARRGDAEGVAALAQIVMRDPDPTLRRQAIGVLAGSRSPEASTALRAAVHDEDISVRTRAVYALRRVEGRRAVPVLAEVLSSDQSPSVRRAAARTLGILGGEEALTALRQAAPDPDPSVRQEVSRALARLAPKEPRSP